MIGPIFIAIVWALGIGQTVHDIKHDRQFSRVCSRAPGAMVAYCLPKDGCWLLNAEGAAACYRRSELVFRRP